MTITWILYGDNNFGTSSCDESDRTPDRHFHHSIIAGFVVREFEYRPRKGGTDTMFQ